VFGLRGRRIDKITANATAMPLLIMIALMRTLAIMLSAVPSR
jgi:hypothetical protein